MRIIYQPTYINLVSPNMQKLFGLLAYPPGNHLVHTTVALFEKVGPGTRKSLHEVILP